MVEYVRDSIRDDIPCPSRPPNGAGGITYGVVADPRATARVVDHGWRVPMQPLVRTPGHSAVRPVAPSVRQAYEDAYGAAVIEAQQRLARPRQFERRWFSLPMLDTLPRRGRSTPRQPFFREGNSGGVGMLGHEARPYAGSIAARGSRTPSRLYNADSRGGPLARSLPQTGAPMPRAQSVGFSRYSSAAGPAAESVSPSAIQLGGMRVPWYVSASARIMYGGSSTDDKRLPILQQGELDPKSRGFFAHVVTTQAGADLFDEYLGGDLRFNSVVDSVSGDLTEIDVEEASLFSEVASGFALAAGTYRAPFGIHNMYTDGAWHFVDSPIIRTRVLGKDGFKSIGADFAIHDVARRLRIHIGAQDLDQAEAELTGFSMGGLSKIWHSVKLEGKNFSDLVWHGRVAHVLPVNGCTAMQIGGSGMFGPNNTGKEGHTTVFGGDVRVDIVDASRNGIRTMFVAEIMHRRIRTDAYSAVDGGGNPNVLSKDELEDWGFYAQAVTSVTRNMAVGVRYDYATGARDSFVGFDATSGASTFSGREADPLRHDRQRISALAIIPIAFNQSKIRLVNTMNPAIRLRIQYSYDMAKFLSGDDAHTVWVGFETELGTKSDS